MVTRDIIQRLLNVINDTRRRVNTLESREYVLLNATQTLTNKTLTTPTIIDSTIARSAITISGGDGLTGGGNLTANRTLAVNQDYDFNWTGLHTFNEHTEMESVDVNGALTVFDDLSVFYGGYYPLFVNVDTVNPNNSNVGIMTNTPDPQFALDVAGPLRAEYLVGPHAIQLSDAKLICDFDGPTPYTTNFDGSAVGHMGQVPTISGHVVFRPGIFGKSAQIAAGATNLITNPSFETNTTNWDSVSSTITRVSTQSFVGEYALHVDVLDASSAGVRTNPTTRIAVTAGTSYTWSVSIKYNGSSRAMNMLIQWYDAGGSVLSNSTQAITINGEWNRYAMTATAPVDAVTAVCRLSRSVSGTHDYWIDAAQFEATGWATPYHDGSLTIPSSWTGTAHASTSTRTESLVTYPNSNVNAVVGTVAAWIKLSSGDAFGIRMIVDIGGTGNTGLALFVKTDGKVRLQYGDGSTTVNVNGTTVLSTGTWYHVAGTWSQNGGKVYVNGVEEGTSSTVPSITLQSTISLCRQQNSAIRWLNGLVDDFVILSRAAPADEIRSIYESNAPVFAQSSVFAWRTPSQVPVWADSEGLWMRAVGGGETLGAYGGAATKSWGGKTLYQSDFLLGNASAGYIHWHAYQNTSDPWGSAGLEVKAQVNITGNSTVSGVLSAGGGDVRLNANGLELSAEATIGAPNQVKWMHSGDVGYYIGALADSSAVSAGAQVDHRQYGTFEIRANGSSSGTIRLMASAGGVGSLGDGNAYGAVLSISDNGSEEKITLGAKVELSATNAALVLNRLTTTQRNAIGAENGMIIYNTTTGKVQARAAGAWVDLH